MALATAALILGFYVWRLDGLQSSGLTTGLLLINFAIAIGIASSKLPRAEKIYWSIVPALGLIPHIPFL